MRKEQQKEWEREKVFVCVWVWVRYWETHTERRLFSAATERDLFVYLTTFATRLPLSSSFSLSLLLTLCSRTHTHTHALAFSLYLAFFLCSENYVRAWIDYWGVRRFGVSDRRCPPPSSVHRRPKRRLRRRRRRQLRCRALVVVSCLAAKRC